MTAAHPKRANGSWQHKVHDEDGVLVAGMRDMASAHNMSHRVEDLRAVVRLLQLVHERNKELDHPRHQTRQNLRHVAVMAYRQNTVAYLGVVYFAGVLCEVLGAGRKQHCHVADDRGILVCVM